MKNSTFIGILLTLLMLLIVAVTALIFLFPRQQSLVQQKDELTAEADQLRQDVAASGLELGIAEATLEAGASALATEK